MKKKEMDKIFAKFNEELNEIKRKRGHIIESSLRIEMMMEFILERYFRIPEDKRRDFYKMLLSENFTFGFKYKVLVQSNLLDQKTRKGLQKLIEIRNTMAHKSIISEEGNHMEFKGNLIEMDKLIEEFDVLEKEVGDVLHSILMDQFDEIRAEK